MKEQLEQIKKDALDALKAVEGAGELESWRTKHLGRSSAVMEAFKQLGGLSKEERPAMGQLANEVRTALEEALSLRQTQLDADRVEASLQGERLDVTLPGRPPAARPPAPGDANHAPHPGHLR